VSQRSHFEGSSIRVKNDEHKIKSGDDLILLPTKSLSLCMAIMKDAVATAQLLDDC
jgi:hypothetical protein